MARDQESQEARVQRIRRIVGYQVDQPWAMRRDVIIAAEHVLWLCDRVTELQGEVARYHRLREAVNEDWPCDDECDSYGHAEDCKGVNFHARFVAMRARVTELTEALRDLRDAARSYQRFMNREISERAGIVIASSDEFVDALFRTTQLLAPEPQADDAARQQGGQGGR